MLSLILLTRNEEENIDPLLTRTCAALQGADCEILFVDDSTDGTVEKILAWQKKWPAIRLEHRENTRGIAGAFRRGLELARGNIIGFMDADLQHDASILPRMLAEMESGADICVGTRYADGGNDGGFGWMRRLISYSVRYAGKVVLPPLRRCSDPGSGYYLVRRDAVDWDRIRFQGCKLLTEILASDPGLVLREVGYGFSARSFGSTKQGAGAIADYLAQLLRLRRNYRDPICLSFFITVLALAASWLLCGFYPFGSVNMIISDGMAQHLPFLAEYLHKLESGQPISYSWFLSLGMPFFSVWAYHLTSPFYLLLLLFPRADFYTAATVLQIVRTGLCASSMAFYLSRRSYGRVAGKYDLSVLPFSVGYGLCAYLISFFSIIIWTDCIILFPPVLLAMERMMRERRTLAYILLLAASLCLNFYFSFMVCLFLACWFFVLPHPGKTWLSDGLRFAWTSIAAALLACVVLIPVGLAMLGKDADAPLTSYYSANALAVLSQFFFSSIPVVVTYENRGANLYCGIFTLILFCLYYLNERIPKREKIARLAFAVFLMVSIYIPALNCLWHGLRQQVYVPGRFTFLLSFLMLTMAWDTLKDIGSFGRARILLSAAFPLCCLLLSLLAFSLPALSVSFLVSAGLLLVYAVALLLLDKRGKPRRFLRSALIWLTCIELAANCFCISFQLGQSNAANSDVFPDSVRASAERVAGLRAQLGVDADGMFSKLESLDGGDSSVSVLSETRMASAFISTISHPMKTAMRSLGVPVSNNTVQIMSMSPLSASLLGINYFYSENPETQAPVGFEFLTESDGIRVYRNQYPMSVGYMVDAGAADIDTEADALTVQNEYLRAGIGLTEDFYKPCAALSDIRMLSGETQNCAADYHDERLYYTVADPGYDSYFSFRIPVEESTGQLYLFLENTAGANYQLRLERNGQVYSATMSATGNYYVGVDLGAVSELDAVTVVVQIPGGTADSGSLKITTGIWDTETLDAVYARLSDELLTVTGWSDNSLEGTVSAGHDGLLATSVIADKGWRAWVDGEPAETATVLGGFLAVPLTEGVHTVRLVYHTPGLALGAALSITTAAALIAVELLKRKKQGALSAPD